jgi:hypothetical protein
MSIRLLCAVTIVGSITVFTLPVYGQPLSQEQREACRTRALAGADDRQEQRRLFRECRREALHASKMQSPSPNSTSSDPQVSQPSSDLASSLDFSGWWGFNQEGCFDKDNQYRVALGKWTKTPNGIEFGSGQEAVGFYDSMCNLSKRVQKENIISYVASCMDEEGEQYNGPGKIIMENESAIRVFMPILSNDGVSLVRCDEVSAKEIIPAQFHGTWGTTSTDCQGESDGKIQITSNTVSPHESHCELQEVLQSDAATFVGRFSCSGEGEEFVEQFALSLNNDELVFNESESKRCP